MDAKQQPLLGDLERSAIIAGAVVAGLIGVTVTLGVAAADPDDGSALLLLATVGVLVGFLAGGIVAAHRTTHRPATHGALAAAAAFVVVQAVGIVRRLIVGDDLSWLSYVYFGLLAMTTGLAGGYLGQLARRRRASLDDQA